MKKYYFENQLGICIEDDFDSFDDCERSMLEYERISLDVCTIKSENV